MGKLTDDVSPPADLESVAGNGLLHRRAFLTGGAAVAGAAAAGTIGLAAGEANAAPPPWMQVPGKPFAPYGQPSRFEEGVRRIVPNTPPTAPGTGASRTPLQMLEGIITPNGLHFERSHNGVPDIDPSKHELIIHGLVRQPLVFSMNTLLRYPMVSRLHFIECAGNSGAGWGAQPPAGPIGAMHGLLSCSDWAGIPLSVLLEEAGIDPRAKWIIAEGADAAVMSRSVPLAKCMDDAMLALYQNGERIRPEQGYPMRLLLPGYEGNMNVKWLRRIKLVETPVHSKDETSKYSDLMPGGKSLQFTFPMEVKSVITRPSTGLNLAGPGLYEISGLAWSGNGRVTRVEVSADGGKSWAEAAMQAPVLSRCLTRFRMAWRWDGGPGILQSRATDETGAVQPTRAKLVAERGARSAYHYNGIQSWEVAGNGEIKNVFA